MWERDRCLEIGIEMNLMNGTRMDNEYQYD